MTDIQLSTHACAAEFWLPMPKGHVAVWCVLFAVINCIHQQLNVGCCSRSPAFKIMEFCRYAQH